jgi:predicted ribosome quality control (RQC) complex YloA/Tae2 family protein
MDSFSYSELKNFAEWLQAQMEGAQLQNLWTNGQVLILQFYKFKDQFLVIDTQPRKPMALYLEEAPAIEKRQKPLVLFLGSHGKNLRWSHCQVQSEKGRVLEIELTGGSRWCRLEIQLIPNAFNILVETPDKKISWEKPRELPLSVSPSEEVLPETDWVAVGRQWLAQRQNKTGSAPAAKKADPRLRDLDKKNKALQSIEDILKSDATALWTELGETLKLSSEVPAHLQSFYKPNQSRSWNMENAFSQSKSLKKKRAGTEERARKLRAEIVKLQQSLIDQPEAADIPIQGPSAGSKLLQKANKKTRR